MTGSTNPTNKFSELSENLRTRLPSNIYDQVSQFTAQAQLAQHRKSKERQQNKFDRYSNSSLSRSEKDKNWKNKGCLNRDNDVKERWVKNLSTRPLSSVEKDVLGNGFNYSVTRIVSHTWSLLLPPSRLPNTTT